MEKRHKENSFLHDLKIDLKTICKMLKKKNTLLQNVFLEAIIMNFYLVGRYLIEIFISIKRSSIDLDLYMN